MEQCPCTPPGAQQWAPGANAYRGALLVTTMPPVKPSPSFWCAPLAECIALPVSPPPTSSLVTPLGMQHNAVNLSIAVSVSGTLKIDRSHTTDLVRFTHIYEIKMIRGDRLCICGSSLLEIRFNSQPQIIWEQALAWCLEPKGTRLRRRDYLLRQTWESLHWTSRHAQLVCSYSNDHFWLSLWLMWSTCKEHCFLVLSLCNDINLAGTLLVMHWKPE